MLILGVAMKSITYKRAGVDLDKYDGLVKVIKQILSRSSLSSGSGHFAGMIDLGGRAGQIIVASVDGVGTKVKIAKEYGWHVGLGHDIVAHCVNDILCIGARPIGFLDYIAFDKLDTKVFKQILSGIATECRRYGIQLIGGETAEMPGVYGRGECDLAGFIIGLTSRSSLLDGSRTRKGDLLVGLPSNGLHTNGYSLARKVLLRKCRMDLKKPPKGWREPLGRVLLKSHTNYFNQVYPLVERHLVSGIAHITGGGIAGNLERILRPGLNGTLRKSLWRVPKIFRLIAEGGPVEDREMFRVFNMGLGMLLVVPHQSLPEVLREAHGSRVVGEITEGEGKVIVS
jgi:phosphoribosylformylglycinamidine cyclo-ligase